MSATLETPKSQLAPPRRIGPRHNGITLTPEEFDAIDNWKEGYRYELVQGVLIVSPMPSREERSPNDLLAYFLLTYKFNHPQGAALAETVSEETLAFRINRRRPDRVVWVATGEPRDLSMELPEIAIEIVSRRKRDQHRDYVLKRDEYLFAGIKEYWIIDRFQRTLTACRGFETVIVIHPGEFYSTPLLPGFELPLNPLLAAADKWSKVQKKKDA